MRGNRVTITAWMFYARCEPVLTSRFLFFPRREEMRRFVRRFAINCGNRLDSSFLFLSFFLKISWNDLDPT